MLHVIVSLALTALLPLAQDDRSPFAQPELDAEARAELIASFRAISEGNWPAEMPDEFRRSFPLDPDGVRAEVARTEVRLQTTRDFEAELAWLDALRVRAAFVPGDRQLDFETLVALALVRSRALDELGRHDEALEASWMILPDQDAVDRTRPTLIEVRGPDVAERKALLAALDDPGLVAARAELALARSRAESGATLPGLEGLDGEQARFLAESFGMPGPEITRVVLEAAKNGSSPTIHQLGLRATPSLAWLVLSPPADYDPRWLDPLDLLAQLDARGAARLIAAFAAEEDSEWRRRALQALRQHATLGSQPSWEFERGLENLAGRHRVPEWLDALAVLLADDLMRSTALQLVEYLKGFDGLTPRIRAELARIVGEGDPAEAEAVLQALAADWRVPSAQPLYEELLGASAPAVRRAAAGRLSHFAPGPAFLAAAGDPDPEIRRALARALRTRQEVVLLGSSTDWLRIRPEPTSERVAAWERLLADPDPTVREAAVEAMKSNAKAPASLFAAGLASPGPGTRAGVVQALGNDTAGRPIDDEELAALCDRALADSDPAVRAALVEVPLPNLRMQLVVLPLLAQDPDREVLARVDEKLQSSWWNDCAAEAVCAALAARMRNVAAPFQPFGGGQAGWEELCMRRVGDSRTEIVTLLELGLKHREEAIVSCGLQKLQSAGVNSRRRVDAFASWIHDLDPDELADLCAWAFALVQDPRAGLVEVALDPPSPTSQAAVRALFLDSDREFPVRRKAGTFAGTLWSDEAEEALFELLRAGDWENFIAPELVVSSLPDGGERTNAIALRVLDDDALRTPVRYEASRRYFDPLQPGADEAAWALIERWIGTGRDVSVELNHVAQKGDPEVVPVLVGAARDPRTMGYAIRAMELHGAPEFVDALGGCLTSRALIGTGSNVQSRIQIAAAESLVRYGTPEAEEWLRQGLLSATPQARGTIQSALETLSAYRAHGERTTPALGTRDEAARELVALLSSPSATLRAEAARGLASLGALEALPRLIPLLEDEDEGVRAAAREALDRLHRSAPPVEEEG